MPPKTSGPEGWWDSNVICSLHLQAPWLETRQNFGPAKVYSFAQVDTSRDENPTFRIPQVWCGIDHKNRPLVRPFIQIGAPALRVRVPQAFGKPLEAVTCATSRCGSAMWKDCRIQIGGLATQGRDVPGRASPVWVFNSIGA